MYISDIRDRFISLFRSLSLATIVEGEQFYYENRNPFREIDTSMAHVQHSWNALDV